MKTVHDLNQNELEELRENYFAQLQDLGEDEDLVSADEIDMSNVIAHYEGVLFVWEDFFCNL